MASLDIHVNSQPRSLYNFLPRIVVLYSAHTYTATDPTPFMSLIVTGSSPHSAQQSRPLSQLPLSPDIGGDMSLNQDPLSGGEAPGKL